MTLPDWLDAHPTPPLCRVAVHAEELDIRIVGSPAPRLMERGMATFGAFGTLFGGLATAFALFNLQGTAATVVLVGATSLLGATWLLPLITWFARSQLRAQRPAQVTLGPHVLTWRDQDLLQRGTVGVHDIARIAAVDDAFGALLILETPGDPVALRLEDPAQARWLRDLVRCWKAERARPAEDVDHVSIARLAQLGREPT
jgi:hypothetical protein